MVIASLLMAVLLGKQRYKGKFSDSLTARINMSHRAVAPWQAITLKKVGNFYS